MDKPKITVLHTELSANNRIPAVSIGMPVYNGAKYICDALDSLLAQTFTDFELIISDNASTDATEQICREYSVQDQRIRYVRQSINLGAMPNFEYVLNLARGECFMWAAHDDRWSLNWLAELRAASKKQAVLNFGEVVAVDSSGKAIRYCRDLNFTGGLIRRSLRYVFQDEFKGKANLFYGLFKTKVITEVLQKESFGSAFATDALILFSVLQVGEIATVNDAQLYKRAGGAGDRVSANYSLINRITASYLIPYYFGYVQRANSLVLKFALFIGTPLLLAHAHLMRLKRIVGRLLKNKVKDEF